jgi:Outer membrane protein beta-barrel domain
MSKFAAAILGTLLFVGIACGQEIPRVEVFGGYSYVNATTVGILNNRQSANGWEASVSGNFSKHFAVEGDVSAYYQTYLVTDFQLTSFPSLSVRFHDYSYMVGPRVNFRPVFVHALFGGDHLGGSFAGGSVSDNGFAAAFGGGVQWPFSSHWAIRGSGDYLRMRHGFFGQPSLRQNNFRAAAGIVYSFGGRH